MFGEPTQAIIEGRFLLQKGVAAAAVRANLVNAAKIVLEKWAGGTFKPRLFFLRDGVGFFKLFDADFEVLRDFDHVAAE